MDLIEKIKRLPPDKRKILERIVDSMIREKNSSEKPKFDWLGKAERLGRDGLYWQRKIMEWREKDVLD
jgi:hypothetical protein